MHIYKCSQYLIIVLFVLRAFASKPINDHTQTNNPVKNRKSNTIFSIIDAYTSFIAFDAHKNSHNIHGPSTSGASAIDRIIKLLARAII